MIPNLRTEFQISELRRQETLAVAARYRAARGGTQPVAKGRTTSAARQRIGAALIQFGQRLQGAPPIEPVGGGGTLAVSRGD